jgi:hypothetical protein
LKIVPIGSIDPSPQNNDLYRPVDPNDPEIQALAESIRVYGVKEPLVISLDWYLLSGHRRLAACKLAGLTEVPVFVEQIDSIEEPDRFMCLLREYNRQRTKTFDEQLREEVVSLNPDETYQALIGHRCAKSAVKVECIRIGEVKARSKISAAKMPMLNAIIKIINDRRQFWPLSDRGIHYPLMNDPPLRHASKPDSRYVNDRASYKDLCDLLTRARLEGHIPWEAIGDPTRPFTKWNVYQDTRAFLRDQIDGFGKGYWRDLMQSQPNHIEIVGEKNTLGKVLNQVASTYCIPTTMGRGYASIDPRHDMEERFKQSGKEKLVVLIVSDFDPDGEQIAESFAQSMHSDFRIPINRVHAIKVGLTLQQIKRHKLPVGGKAKKKSPNYKKFVRKYGTDVYEVEALDPVVLQRILTETIDRVIDTAAFNREVDAEKRDAVHLEGVRRMVCDLLKDARFDELK